MTQLYFQISRTYRSDFISIFDISKAQYYLNDGFPSSDDNMKTTPLVLNHSNSYKSLNGSSLQDLNHSTLGFIREITDVIIFLQ